MAGKKKRPRAPDGEQPRRGMRRSIRYEAVEVGDDDQAARDKRPRRGPDAPPEILLRMLTVQEALARLDSQLRAYAARNQRQVLVVHGKGGSSPGGVSVLAPAVRNWCDAHPSLVVSWSEAPLRWGGAGAIVVNLA